MARVFLKYSAICNVIFLCKLFSCSHSLKSVEIDTEFAKPPKLLLVSFDGFRWDYLDIAHKLDLLTPNLDALIANGSTVAPGGVKNSFPTKTLPNHYTMVTGMYPGNHGVVHNTFLDPEYGDFPGFGNTTIWWNNGTEEKDVNSSIIPMPIWIANQLAEKNESSRYRRRSGVMQWPGGGARLYNERSHKWRLYDYPETNESKIEELVQWFADESEPVNFAALYFKEPDFHGHQWGPTSPDLMKLITYLDTLVGYLLQLLRENDLYDDMNIIITSDHGMGEITDHVMLSDHLNISTFTRYGSSPVLLIWPHEGFEDAIYANISKVPKMSAYRKHEIPAEYHYTFNRRIPPLLFVADPGVSLCTTKCSDIKGNHGYNNSWSDMHPFFIANGPAFRRNHVSPQFNNVDMYPLMCKVLGIQPGPHDGDLRNIDNIFEQHMPKSYVIWVVCFALGLPIIIIALVFTVKACRTRVLKYHRVNKGVRMSGVQESLLSSDDEM